jgi:hypothetical protein
LHPRPVCAKDPLVDAVVALDEARSSIMSKKGGYTPNDQRSIVKNPTSAAHSADRANRIAQGHANAPQAPEAPAAPASPTK